MTVLINAQIFNGLEPSLVAGRNISAAHGKIVEI
ncbi:hypothetical protein DFR51_1838 [Sphingosinicella microcystinivorans]|uniref:Uncharacterized protein n=1 Tax=Sphingosinicella microcystinivorans TaxID=335406 RepID=A0ABX9SXK6_SPHMI|nr:hypothetical protein DFR51_1838 [Sphingosinicella microcystinivorans]